MTMTDIWTSSSIQDLTDEDLFSFQEIVLRDVKNKHCTSEEKTILLNNLDLWLFSLRNLRKEIELQLTKYKSNIKVHLREMKNNYSSQESIDQYLASESNWRNNAIKFLTAIERKTLYVKLLISSED